MTDLKPCPFCGDGAWYSGHVVQCNSCGGQLVKAERGQAIDAWNQRSKPAVKRASPTKLVILESPYAGNILRNLKYARRCLRDSLARGEAPIASHLLYTQVLRDADPQERSQGIAAGTAWMAVSGLVAVYTDLGVSPGMSEAIKHACAIGVPVEYRSIGDA